MSRLKHLLIMIVVVAFCIIPVNAMPIDLCAQKYKLTVSHGIGSGGYEPGTVVTVFIRNTDVPEGKAFNYWSGLDDSEYYGDYDRTQTTIKFTMPARNVNLKAVFMDAKGTQRSLHLTSDAGIDNTVKRYPGATIIITAPNNDDYRFVKWSVLDGVKLINNTHDSDRRIEFIMPDRDINLHIQYDIKVRSVSLTKYVKSLEEGESSQFEYQIYPEKAKNKNVTWSSSDTKVATVTKKGLVTGVKKGEATITLSVDGENVSTSLLLTVETPRLIKEINFANAPETMKAGEEYQLNVTYKPENAVYNTLYYESSNGEIVNVNSKGLLKAYKPGKATIRVYATGGAEKSFNVTVEDKAIPVESISFDKATNRMAEGDTQQLKVVIWPANANNYTVKYSSSDTSVAKVSSKGLITAVKPGTTMISAVAGNKETHFKLTVTKRIVHVTKVEFVNPNRSMTIGTSQETEVKITPDNANDYQLEYASSDKTVATINDKGVISAKKVGTTRITVKAEGMEDSFDLSVQPEEILPTSIKLSKNSVTLVVGESIKVAPTISPDNSSDKTVQWSSKDKEIAKVDKKGNITAVYPGETDIMAKTINGKKATCHVIVKPADATACQKFGFCHINGKDYWYEDWARQGVKGDKKNIWDTVYGEERGREIYDPVTDAWYWLDCIYNGAKASNKEVWMPYIFQDDLKTGKNPQGKWVRYNKTGAMIKGWYEVKDVQDCKLYPSQIGNTYYYDLKTGAMMKGTVVIDGISYHFDEKTGVLIK